MHSWAVGAAGVRGRGGRAESGAAVAVGPRVCAADSAPQLSPRWLRPSTAALGGLQGGSWGLAAGFRIRVSSGGKSNVVGTWGEASQKPLRTFGAGDGTEEKGTHQRKSISPEATLAQATVASPLP